MACVQKQVAPVFEGEEMKEAPMNNLSSHAQMTELASPRNGLHHYLLLDGVKMEPVLKWVYQLIDNPECYPIYKNTRYHDVIDISPYLVKVPTDSDVMEQFENDLGPQGKGIWISSFLDIEALGASFSQLLWITTESGQYLHFRFYDPITLSRLMPVLQAEEQASLYKGIENIVWYETKPCLWHMLTLTNTHKDATHLGPVRFKTEWINAIVSSN